MNARTPFMSDTPQPLEPDAQPDVLTYDARALIPHGSQVSIILDGTRYVLRITRAGKLILTK
ncbi:MAG: hemin uptake protein HemP [Pseudomonadota bacterium]